MPAGNGQVSSDSAASFDERASDRLAVHRTRRHHAFLFDQRVFSNHLVRDQISPRLKCQPFKSITWLEPDRDQLDDIAGRFVGRGI